LERHQRVDGARKVGRGGKKMGKRESEIWDMGKWGEKRRGEKVGRGKKVGREGQNVGGGG